MVGRNVVSKVKEKVTNRPLSDSSSDSRNPSSERSIPPEPIQLSVDGDFSLQGVTLVLQQLNLQRANRQGVTLQWDTELAHSAEERAHELMDGAEMSHGETVYITDPDVPEPQYTDAVTDWLSQETMYKGQLLDDETIEKCGQYTQCMWHSAHHVGMAKKKAPNGKWYVVARFSPSGNALGEKPF